MPIGETVTIDGNTYEFDFIDKRIDVDASLAVLNVNDLWDAIQLAQAGEIGVTFDAIANAEGTTQLAVGISTFLTVILFSTWEINTLRSSGSFQVQGGNLVRQDGSDPFRDNPLITYINNLSQAGVITTVNTGSGLSDAQAASIAAIQSKTDQLTFTQANSVDANIHHVNDTRVSGTGADGDEWGP